MTKLNIKGLFSHKSGFLINLVRAVRIVLKTNTKLTLLLAFLTILQGVSPALQLWISKGLIDTSVKIILINEPNTDQIVAQLISLIVLQASLQFLNSLISQTHNTIRDLLGEQVRNHLSLAIFQKANEMEISFFECDWFYNKLQNAYQEVGYRPLEMVSQLFSLVNSIIVMSSVIFILFRLNWILLPLIILSTIPSLLIQNKFGYKKFQMLKNRVSEYRKQQYFGMLLTSNWFIKEIRVFNLEKFFLNIYTSLYEKFYQENSGLLIKHNIYNQFASSVTVLGWLLASAFVLQQLISHTITVGDFSMFLQAVSLTQSQIQLLIGIITGLYSNTLFFQNYHEFIIHPHKNLSEGTQWNEPISDIEFQNVSFTYPGSKHPSLCNISFKVQVGQTIAIVGRNGAGKTTLAKLLCKLYEPDSGEILFNGKNINKYSIRSLQNQISIMFQDYGQYNLTAEQNIEIGQLSETVNASRVKSSAKASGIDTLIDSFPKKYETTLGKLFDDGVQLSSGEWQKIALARCLYRNCSILVMDEPTAALDPESENRVINDVLYKNNNKITFLITHRFSSLINASTILVLENGYRIESGTHEYLMSKDGYYAKCVNLQSQKPEDL